MAFERALGLVLVLAGCGGATLDEATCPPGGTALTYESFGRGFFARDCNRCHAASVTERDGAPPEYVFDTLEQVRHHKARIYARSAGENDSMPPGPDDPPREERDRLAEWLACGAP